MFISSYGLNPNARTGQSTDAIFGLMIAFALVLGIFLAISGLLLAFWPLQGSEWDKTKEELKRIPLQKEITFLKELERKRLVKDKTNEESK